MGSVWAQSDGVGRTVALLLLLMSVASWALILWKAWVLRRAGADLQMGLQAFWNAPDWAVGRQRLVDCDREGLMLPLLDAAQAGDLPESVAGQGPVEARATRRLRQALQSSLSHLRQGQVVLASVGSTSMP